MNKTLSLLAVILTVGLAFAGCKSNSKADNGEGGGCGASACGGSECGGNDGGESAGANDAAVDATIKMYTDGTMKAAPFVAMHSFVSVGQYWEVTNNFGGMKSVNKWQVSAKAAGTKSEFIVESDNGQGYILAYQIDAWAGAGKPNVTKAWIGKAGEEPKEIKIMEWKKAEGGATAPSGIVLTEEFSDIEMCGESFNGDLTTVKSDGNTTKTWIAENGWFNKLIKMEMNGDTVMELTGCDFNEKPEVWLKWEKDE
ncbi:MAG: hypothetical protein KDB68_15260 [Planctomycetes bacterium]|nr:hypothetical protein [Planctomycetota bacterium]